MADEVKQLGEDHEVWLKCFVTTLPRGNNGTRRREYRQTGTHRVDLRCDS